MKVLSHSGYGISSSNPKATELEIQSEGCTKVIRNHLQDFRVGHGVSRQMVRRLPSLILFF